MRWQGHRSALALGSALLVTSSLAGCTDRPDGAGRSQSELPIVQRVQIDRDGNQVEPVTDTRPVDPSGNGSAVCTLLSIAIAAPLSGPDSAIGDNINTGMQLAVDKHNEANPGCQIQLKTFDTEGDAAKARSIAPTIVEDAFTVGLVGPAFSDVARITVRCSTKPAWSQLPRRRAPPVWRRPAGEPSSEDLPTTTCKARGGRHLFDGNSWLPEDLRDTGRQHGAGSRGARQARSSRRCCVPGVGDRW